MEEITDNELIARFMGAEFVRKPHVFYPDKFTETYIFKGHPGNWRVEKETKSHLTAPMMAYHTDWDWLMPVLEKIVKLGLYKMTSVQAVELRALRFGIPIEKVYEKTVEFIRWYNQNKKP